MANYMLKFGEKARTVTAIVWVEDLQRRWGDHWEKKWYGYLADMRTMVACSPIHDKDTYSEEDVENWCKRHIDPDTGTVATEYTNVQPKVGDPKKAHFHIIIIVKGPMKREDFSDLMLGVVWIMPNKWQRVIHLDTMTRYLAHMDNPEKFKYDWTDVIPFGGFSLKPLTIAKSDEYTKATALAGVLEYIEDNKLRYYHQLVRWARQLGDYDIFCCVTGRAGMFIGLFNSIRQEKQDKAQRQKEEQKRQEEQ